MFEFTKVCFFETLRQTLTFVTAVYFMIVEWFMITEIINHSKDYMHVFFHSSAADVI